MKEKMSWSEAYREATEVVKGRAVEQYDSMLEAMRASLKNTLDNHKALREAGELDMEREQELQMYIQNARLYMLKAQNSLGIASRIIHGSSTETDEICLDARSAIEVEAEVEREAKAVADGGAITAERDWENYVAKAEGR